MLSLLLLVVPAVAGAAQGGNERAQQAKENSAERPSSNDDTTAREAPRGGDDSNDTRDADDKDDSAAARERGATSSSPNAGRSGGDAKTSSNDGAASDSSVAEITVVWNDDCDAVVVESSKDLSNVVLELEGGTQRFEGLTGTEDTFSGDSGGTILGVWVKSGSFRSGDGPGFGARFDAPERCLTTEDVNDTEGDDDVVVVPKGPKGPKGPQGAGPQLSDVGSDTGAPRTAAGATRGAAGAAAAAGAGEIGEGAAAAGAVARSLAATGRDNLGIAGAAMLALLLGAVALWLTRRARASR